LNFSHCGKEDVIATTETFVPGRLYEMPLADLQADPNQPRKYLDPQALDELTESVKQQGEPSFATAPTPEKKPKIIVYINPCVSPASRGDLCPADDRRDGPPQPGFWN